MALRHVGRKCRPRWLTATTVGSRGIQMSSGKPLPINSSQVLPARSSSRAVFCRAVSTSPVVNGLPRDHPPHTTKNKQRPKVVMFHNPCSERSCKMMDTIKRAQVAWPFTKFKIGDPLDIELVVETRLPTIEEFQDIYQLLATDSWTIFLQLSDRDQGDFRSHPTGARSLLQVITSLQEQQRALLHSGKIPPSEPAEAPQRVEKPPVPLARSPHEARAQARQLLEAKFPPPTEVLDDPEHPLAGTDKFLWPVIVCWDLGLASTGGHGTKALSRMFKKLNEKITGIKQPTPEEIKAMALAEKQSRYTMPIKEESPPEDDTLRWFNEQEREGKRPFPRY